MGVVVYVFQITSLYPREDFTLRHVPEKWKNILEWGMLASVVVATAVMYNCAFGCDDYKDLAKDKLNFGAACTCEALPYTLLTTLFVSHAVVWSSNFANLQREEHLRTL